MSDIKKCFTSRFVDGVLLELDFSQLEIYVLAYLSGDPTLRSDLLSGADLHSISALNLFGGSFTPKERKIAKQLSFQLQYGAGYKSMAESNGVSKSLAKQFIKNYYERYPFVKAYQDDLIAEVQRKRVSGNGRRTVTGNPSGTSTLKSLTGRRYTFLETDSPDWMSTATGFSPTQIKNYQVQGFATGDIVPMVLGKLYRAVKQWPVEENVLLINTVHDSVMFDCENKRVAVVWAKRARDIMQDAPKYLKEHFNIDFDLPLNVGIEMGSNWGEMEEYIMI